MLVLEFTSLTISEAYCFLTGMPFVGINDSADIYSVN